MLGLLMINQDLKIVKVALAVETPRSREDLVDVRVSSFLLRHGFRLLCCRFGGSGRGLGSAAGCACVWFRKRLGGEEMRCGSIDGGVYYVAARRCSD